MGRLTKRHGKHAVQIGGETRRNDVGWLKLAEYEDLEEQGYRMVNIDWVMNELEERRDYQKEFAVDKNFRIGVVNGFNNAIEIVKGGAV